MDSSQVTDKAGLVGRILRILIGILFLYTIIPYYFIAPASVVIQTFLLILGLAVFYILLDIFINRFAPNINPILGAVFANAPILLMYLLGKGAVQLSAISFVGISLILIGLRADKGCEVMIIPGLIFKRHTNLACFFFSPIDWLEKQITGIAN